MTSELVESASETSMTEVLRTVDDILSTVVPGSSDGPADRIVALGNCLSRIGERLKPLTIDQSRRVIASVAALHGIQVQRSQ